MAIHKRGESYVVTIGSQEERYRKSFKTLADAVKAEKLEEAIRLGVVKSSQSLVDRKRTSLSPLQLSQTLRRAYELTLRDTWSQNKSNAHIKSAMPVLKFFGDDMPVSEINSQLIREMVEELEDTYGNVGSTVNAKLSALSMMLKTACQEQWLETIPYFKRRSEGTHRIRWYDAEEELRMLATCKQLGLLALADFIICAIDTGFRRMELLDFRVKEYRHNLMVLHPDETKTSKARSVPPTLRVVKIIQSRSLNDRLFDDLTPQTLRTQWDSMRSVMNMSKDPQFVVHTLRHTCASRLAMSNQTAQFIQMWMGHATPLTTARYMHLAPNKLLEGTNALDDYRKSYIPMLKVV
jgi:integrase